MGVDVTLIAADIPAALRAWREQQSIGFRMLSDVGHRIASLLDIPISRRHPAARRYQDGFIQPAFFGFRKNATIYRFVIQPGILNGWGALNRPSPSTILDAMAAKMDGDLRGTGS